VLSLNVPTQHASDLSNVGFWMDKSIGQLCNNPNIFNWITQMDFAEWIIIGLFLSNPIKIHTFSMIILALDYNWISSGFFFVILKLILNSF
jgi:hypothetical protein